MVSSKINKKVQRGTQMKTFSVTLVVEVDEPNNLLSAAEDTHTEDIYDMIHNMIHDIDDVKATNVLVRQR
mgnify:CR=1